MDFNGLKEKMQALYQADERIEALCLTSSDGLALHSLPEDLNEDLISGHVAALSYCWRQMNRDMDMGQAQNFWLHGSKSSLLLRFAAIDDSILAIKIKPQGDFVYQEIEQTCASSLAVDGRDPECSAACAD